MSQQPPARPPRHPWPAWDGHTATTFHPLPLTVVGFTGRAGSGKDTAGAYLVEHYGFRRLSFAEPLKAMLAAAGFPEPATQDEKEAVIPWLGRSWRHLGQTLGTEWGRQQVHPDLWVLLARERMQAAGGRWVITDVRFDNEAELVRSLGGTLCHITGRAHDMTTATSAHASEQGVKREPTDIVINNGFDRAYLERQLAALMHALEAEGAA